MNFYTCRWRYLSQRGWRLDLVSTWRDVTDDCGVTVLPKGHVPVIWLQKGVVRSRKEVMMRRREEEACRHGPGQILKLSGSVGTGGSPGPEVLLSDLWACSVFCSPASMTSFFLPHLFSSSSSPVCLGRAQICPWCLKRTTAHLSSPGSARTLLVLGWSMEGCSAASKERSRTKRLTLSHSVLRPSDAEPLEPEPKTREEDLQPEDRPWCSPQARRTTASER